MTAVLQLPRELAFRSVRHRTSLERHTASCRAQVASNQIPTPPMLRRTEVRLHITGYPQFFQQPKPPFNLVRLPRLRSVSPPR